MTNRKTIGFTIHSLNAGGAERVVTSLANELIEHYNVRLITLEQCQSFYELNSKVQLLHCGVTVPENQNKIDALKTHANTVKKISSFIKSESIDLIIGFTTSVNVLTVISARLNGIPSIISERKNSEVNPPNKFWMILRNLMYKYANYLVVQTSANKAYFSQIVSSKKIVIIPNPIASVLTSKRSIVNIDKRSKTILTVGRLDANKSQDLLIRAFSNISKNNDWKLQIIGDGNKMEEFKNVAIEHNIKESVSFLGNLTNVHDYYNDGGIFVFTSKSEGYPNALAEALYFGMPSISTNCPHGPSDLIENNSNGILIEVDNQKMLEVQLERLIDDKDLRYTLSESAINKSKELDIGIITALWINYFDNLL